MRNLKKVLALVMVLALSLSMVISAGAAWSDVKPTDANASAIDLLTSLKITDGYPDGTYKGENAVTRAEFVSMLYRSLKGTADTTLYKGPTSFPDVNAGDWYNGAVNWAVSVGVIGGYPDGTFKPNRTVTVAEASKMIIVALGYDANNYVFPFGFVNKAQEIGVLADVSGYGYDTNATRNMIATVLNNTLFTPAPLYPVLNASGVITGYDTLITKVFAVKQTTAVLTGTSSAVGAATFTATGKVALNYDSNADGTLDANSQYSFSKNVDDLLFHKVKIWYKGTSLASATSIVNIVDSTNTIISAKLSAFSADTATVSPTDYKVTVNGTTYTGFEPAVNATNYAYAVLNSGAAVPSSTIDYGSTADASITLIKPDYTGAKWSAVVASPVVTTVGYADASFFTLGSSLVAPAYTSTPASGVLYYSSGNTAYAGIAKDDVVYAYPKVGYNSTTFNVVKATTVSNVTLDSYSGTTTYVLGGVSYTFAGNTPGTDLASGSLINTDLVFGKGYNIIANSVGKIVKITAYDGSTGGVPKLIYVTSVSVTQSSLIGTGLTSTITGLLSDGTTATFTMDGTALGSTSIMNVVSGSTEAWENSLVGSITAPHITNDAVGYVFSYGTSASTGKITSFAPVTGAAVTDGTVYAYDSTSKAFKTGGAITNIASDTTVVYYHNGTSASVYTGTSIPSFSMTTSGTVTIATQVNGSALKVVVLKAATSPFTGSTTNSDTYYGRVVKQEIVSDGTNAAYKYTLAYNGKVEAIETVSNALSNGAPNIPAALNKAAGTFVKISVDKTSGKITALDTVSTVALTAIPSGTGTNANVYGKVTAFTSTLNNAYFITLNKLNANAQTLYVKSDASYYTIDASGNYAASTAWSVNPSLSDSANDDVAQTSDLFYKADVIIVEGNVVAVFTYPVNYATAAEKVAGAATAIAALDDGGTFNIANSATSLATVLNTAIGTSYGVSYTFANSTNAAIANTGVITPPASAQNGTIDVTVSIGATTQTITGLDVTVLAP